MKLKGKTKDRIVKRRLSRLAVVLVLGQAGKWEYRAVSSPDSRTAMAVKCEYTGVSSPDSRTAMLPQPTSYSPDLANQPAKRRVDTWYSSSLNMDLSTSSRQACDVCTVLRARVRAGCVVGVGRAVWGG